MTAIESSTSITVVSRSDDRYRQGVWCSTIQYELRYDTEKTAAEVGRFSAGQSITQHKHTVINPLHMTYKLPYICTCRYLINDACVLLGKPLVSGSAVGLEGQVTVFAPRVGPCYR